MNALTFGRNGWATLVAPGDIDAVHTVRMSPTVVPAGDGHLPTRSWRELVVRPTA